MSLQTMFKISGVDVTSKLISYSIDKTWGEAITIGDCDFVRSINDLITLSPGLVVEVWRGWTTSTDLKIFSGYIESFNPENGKVKITIKDKLWDSVRKEVNKIYDSSVDVSAGKISEIFKDLMETYAGLTTSVQDSGTSILLTKFVCNHTDIFERCKKLADILDWQFYYRADTDLVYFEPQGMTTNSTILQIGTNIVGVPKWNYDSTEMINDLTVTGAYQEIETTESGQIGVTTGYATSGILLNFTPISVKVYGDASNPPTTLKTGGLPDSSSSFDYYIEKENKLVIPKDGTTFSANDYYEIRYSHAVPIPVHLYNQFSIDSYGSFEKTINYDDLRNVADAEIRATNYLNKYSKPFIYSTLKLKSNILYNIKEGDYIRVVDNVNKPAIDEFFVITRYTYRFPNDYDEILVGDKTWRLASWQSTIEEKLKRIDESNIENTDLLTDIVVIDNSLFNTYTEQPRYAKVGSKTYDSTSKYIALSDSNTIVHRSLLGTYKLLGTGGDNFLAEVMHSIIQYENNYEEEFVDTDFKGASTNATWDTANHRVDFTAGKIAQSSSIDYNNGTITAVYFSATISSGSFLLQVTADGTNWETATNNATHTFSHTGTNLMWRATENGASTGRITKVEMSAYH